MLRQTPHAACVGKEIRHRDQREKCQRIKKKLGLRTLYPHREPKSLGETIEMTSKWMEYYNRERPHSALSYCSPLMYREKYASPVPANFWRRFFRSGTARVAPLRALAALGPPCLRFKIAPKWIDIRGYRVV